MSLLKKFEIIEKLGIIYNIKIQEKKTKVNNKKNKIKGEGAYSVVYKVKRKKDK